MRVFTTQQWKDEDGRLRSEDEMTPEDFRFEMNTSGCNNDVVFKHVTTQYAKLSRRQKALSVDKSDDGDDKTLSRVLLKIFK